MKIKASFPYLILWYTTLFSVDYQLTLADGHRGLFSVFFSVLGVLDFYEKSPHGTSLVIDFGNSGLYYDKSLGPNWWNYYFDSIMLGKSHRQRKTFSSKQQAEFSLQAAYAMSHARGHALISRYIRLKTVVQKKIDQFVIENFKDNWMIGVHYRGTDKISEAPSVAYNVVVQHLKKEIEQRKDAKIFVATDEENFLKLMHEKFPGKVLAIDTFRSVDGEPVHYANTMSPYKKGEDAIIDCVLLSKCKKLYRTSSNLSAASMRFNPSIEEVLLSKNGYEKRKMIALSNSIKFKERY